MTTVADIGERKLIERMMRYFTPLPDMPLPFWDDASAISLGDGKAVVLKTDMLVWKTDIPEGMNYYQAARKAVVMNFSDLGSKGVLPQAFLASLALPKSTPASAVEDMAKGFEDGTKEYGGHMIGGDTNEACDVIIAGMAYGLIEERYLMKRQGSNPRDILCTTGPFGNTSAAFKIMLEGYNAPKKLRETLVKTVFMPKARVNEGIVLARTDSVTSCMDSSDGLAISLYDLARSSGHGFEISEIPISKNAEVFAEYNDLDAKKLALYGGEEYELIFTVNPKKIETVEKAFRKHKHPLIKIGKVIEEKKITYIDDGKVKTVKMRGWEHFQK